jgi:hypothetical protein
MQPKSHLKRGVAAVGIAGLCAAFSSPAHADVLLRYSFSTVGNVENLKGFGDGFQPTEKDPNVVATSISLFNLGLTMQVSKAAPAPADAPFLRIIRNNVASTDRRSAVTTNALINLAIHCTKPIKLASLDFDVAGGPDGPSGYVVFSERNIGPDGWAAADVTTSHPTYTHVSIAINELLTPSGGEDFRFYMYGPTPSSWVDFDNIVFTGDVPEPGAVAVLGLGSLALFRRRRARV